MCDILVVVKMPHESEGMNSDLHCAGLVMVTDEGYKFEFKSIQVRICVGALNLIFCKKTPNNPHTSILPCKLFTSLYIAFVN